MKKNKTISKLVATAAMAVVAIAPSFAQTNLGAACGCPAVASRPTVLMSTLAVVGTANDGDLLGNTILTCDKTYILDKKIYVPSGLTLNVAPGTVIKGRIAGNPEDANALIVERGGKIIAAGAADCQIVFTAEADPLDGTFGISNKGTWGGVVLLGKAFNNLISTNVYGSGTGADGVGFVEGYAAADARNLYGMPAGQTDDNDNSGVLKYVSIRHAGANIGTANELNGLSLGSVGRATVIEHIEIISNDDDGIEFFGGTVNVKYITAMFGNDDMFDYDLGWTGKAQFVFGIQTANATMTGADNGFEMDGDDDKKNPTYLSHPVIYNATIIGNGFTGVISGGPSGPAALNSKEANGGEVYNSVFANFKYGMNLANVQSGRSGVNAYQNWNSDAFITKNCNFVNMVTTLVKDKSVATVSNADSTKFFTTDGNVASATLAGLDFGFAIDGTTNAVSDKFNATPAPAVASTITPAADGFFKQVSYRGAFNYGEKSWLSDWSYATLLNVTGGLQPCPTDINADGTTNNVDFLQLLGQFNSACQ